MLLGVVSYIGIDLVGMPTQRSPQPANLRVGFVGEHAAGAAALFPQESKRMFQQGQVPRFGAHIRKQRIYEARFSAPSSQRKAFLNTFVQLLNSHSGDVV